MIIFLYKKKHKFRFNKVLFYLLISFTLLLLILFFKFPSKFKKLFPYFNTHKIESSSILSNDTLIKCAKLAAYYSKGRLSSNVPVDYCFVNYVKKPNGSKPGMVIYTNNKTLNVTPSIEN